MGEKHKTVFKDWCNTTSAHGFYDWQNSSSICAKGFWVFVITLMIAAATSQTAGLIINFVSHPHHVTRIGAVEGAEAQFPNVTICSYNKASKEKLEYMNITNYNLVLPMLFQPILESANFDLGMFESSVPQIRLPYIEAWQEYQQSANAIKDTKMLYNAIAPDPEDILKSCVFKGREFGCTDAVTFAYRTKFGRCFTVTPPLQPAETKPVQKFPGVGNGMKLIINPMLNDYPGVVWNNEIHAGIVLDLHYDSVSHSIKKPIGIERGKSFWISMRRSERSFVQSLQHVFKKTCVKHGEKNLTVLDGKYTRENCLADCSYRIVQELIDCVPISMTKPDVSICSPDNVVSNGKTIWKELYGANRDVQEECRNICPHPCDPPTQSIEFSLSSVPFVAEPNKDEFNKIVHQFFVPENERTSEVQDYSSIIYLDIFFEELGYTHFEIDEKSKLLDLISSIGGNLGLWLGVSVVTFIQMIVTLAGGYCCNRKNSVKQIMFHKNNTHPTKYPEGSRTGAKRQGLHRFY